ncbi:hypothetical protein [Microbacterium immunditiarum]|uniref:Putative nucleic acid-binding protein n=1 Tax=Microbacterium immunditiarum TaxID=337480 RepID=A0A7Y9KJM2_9MICO|nr:hypothetical protein [Microbacterium immunditiarum]NYE19915.1 putative nucleic acid-binding protein [Microbacterium immunditiarum]
MDDLREIVGTPLALSAESLREAAVLASSHGLSFYDASWAAAARGLGIVLVSTDGRLQEAGLAESAAETVARLRLSVPPAR